MIFIRKLKIEQDFIKIRNNSFNMTKIMNNLKNENEQ